MTDNSGKIIKSIRPSRIVWPIIFGLAATAYFFYKEFDAESFNGVRFSIFTILWIGVAFGLMIIRDLGYMIRLRILTGGELGWRKLFNIIMLWEFTSAVTPSAVGGTSVAIFFLNKEGISLGRSAGVVMVTSFLDELFFVIMFPLILLLTGIKPLFISADPNAATTYFLYIALAGYMVKLLYVIVLSYGLFFNPRGFKWLLLKIFKWSVLRKWRPDAANTGDELIETSLFFKKRNLTFWLKSFGATCLSWIARYWVVNALVVAFMGIAAMGWWEHIMLYGKQLVMWIMMLISPTPGGSGFAEYVFKEFLSADVNASQAIALALVWRLVSYYPYLIIGAFVVPRWINRHFISRGKQ